MATGKGKKISGGAKPIVKQATSKRGPGGSSPTKRTSAPKATSARRRVGDVRTEGKVGSSTTRVRSTANRKADKLGAKRKRFR